MPQLVIPAQRYVHTVEQATTDKRSWWRQLLWPNPPKGTPGVTYGDVSFTTFGTCVIKFAEDEQVPVNIDEFALAKIQAKETYVFTDTDGTALIYEGVYTFQDMWEDQQGTWKCFVTNVHKSRPRRG